MGPKAQAEQQAAYVRVYSDEDGQTHFADVVAPLDPLVFAPPAPALNVSAGHGAERILFAGARQGWAGDWHTTPKRQFVFCLAGELHITTSDGATRTFRRGDALLLEDTEGRGHMTRFVKNVLTAVVQLE